MSFADIIASIALVVSVINFAFYYRISTKSVNPAINHFLKNLPPYGSPKETTEIKIKNVGTAQARPRQIFLNFSWDKDLQVVLFDEQDFEDRIYSLAPNEELTFYKTLPEPPIGEREHLTITTIIDNGLTKEDVFELGIRTRRSFG